MNRRSLLASLVATLTLPLVTASAATAADIYNAYAGPNTWGSEVFLRAHLGPAPYTISYTALGKTSVIGEVTYYGPDGRPVTRQFIGSINFRTGNVIASPMVRFKGTPFGSAVRVSVTP